MSSFHTKVAGVTFDGRQAVIEGLRDGEALLPVREPSNPFDENAIALHTTRGMPVGFFSKALAADIAPKMDAGTRYIVNVSEVTGREHGKTLGVNVVVIEGAV